MKIDLLADFPGYIPSLAPAILQHWGSVLLGDTLEIRIRKMEAHLNRNQLPMAWVAHDDGQVFGTAALRQHDLDGREDLSPWLGGVFVLPSFRRRGIASSLCQAVEVTASAMGIVTLYLFTLDQQTMYQKLGWQRFERATWRGRSSDIMVKTLASP